MTAVNPTRHEVEVWRGSKGRYLLAHGGLLPKHFALAERFGPGTEPQMAVCFRIPCPKSWSWVGRGALMWGEPGYNAGVKSANESLDPLKYKDDVLYLGSLCTSHL